MAESSSADAGALNLNLGPDEKRVYGQLFRQADTESVGVVTGEIAVKFFEKTRLDSRILGEIWQLADQENRGFLTPAGFGIALRLIGHAQAGREPSLPVALQPGPIPRFDGFTPAPPPPLAPAPTGSPQPISAQGTGNAPIRIPPLTPDKVAQYAGLFERQQLQPGNLLGGEQARQIFERSNLPNETLGRIWQLADTEQRGALVQTEFVIAMHLLTSMKSGALRALPSILPAPLYEAATRRGSTAGRPQSPGGPTAPISAIPRQLSGQAGHQMPMRTGSPLAVAHGRSPLAPQSTGDPWLITAADKQRFDVIYDGLDKTKKGFITGEEAVPFLSQSNLPEAALANIWDLADINSEGRLSRDEFAVAMYLIRQQRMKQGELPQALPANLIPPSMRAHARPSTATNAFDAPPPQQTPVQQPPPPKPASALDDLFGLESAPGPAPPQSSVPTGAPVLNDPFAGSASPLAPASPARASPTATGSSFKPFVPSSSFGRSLNPQATGGSASGAQPVPPPPAEDLLGDSEPQTQAKGNDMNETMELANLSNQISTLSKSMQDVAGQRNATQNELTQSSQQKKNFEQRLAQLRTMYENQAKEVRDLQDKLNASRNETKKLQAESLALDGQLHDLQTQYQTVATALQADQQENSNLKEKIRAVNAEVASLKPQIEKLKSEARQQKGLVAINKKQLTTNEGERDKLKTEAEDLTKENLELARQLSQSPPPNPPPQVASPALSNASGSNPFFRRTGSTDMMGSFASPGAPKTYNDKSFDDVFGPAIPAFKPQTTGASAASTGSFATPISNSPIVSRNQNFTSEASTTGPAPPEPRQVLSPAGDVPTSAPLEATATGGSTTAAKGPQVRPADPGAFFDGTKSDPPAGAGGDPFSAMDEAKAKDDFESAFASFKNAKSAPEDASTPEQPKTRSAFDSEFPPISELEKDDSTDSEDDQGGFDDDFAPASPLTKQAEKASSPSVSKAVASDGPASTSGETTQAKADDLFGSVPPPGAFPEPEQAPSAEKAPAAAGSDATTTGMSKQSSSFDDLDDDFADLEDAKEGSTADDDFQNISRSGLDDFNAAFDSPPPAAKSDVGAAPPGSSHGRPAPFGNESTFDFTSIDNTASQVSGTAPTEGAPKGPTQADNHDWDAIFASLDDAPPAQTSGSLPPPGSAGNGAAPPAPAAATAAAAAEPGKEAPGGKGGMLSGPRPSGPGRALTEDGEHDDPILKNLTSMGYSRGDALNALEKYDYNLERAANFLASQS
ncbi:UBA/TS-N domain-containing protein [Diaporthe helianthi]|uniref:UBA/TS-N domain-containing protein n=1 Tax=Diaporthe helianthi TaxID=158607 RepID=A0A2P5I232_DIAHE|nr:UBA/TS-N domain-containing protein [Diaporthe helianthi]